MVDWEKPIQDEQGYPARVHAEGPNGCRFITIKVLQSELWAVVAWDGTNLGGYAVNIINVPEPEPKRSWKVYVHVGIDDRLFCTLSPIAVEPTFGRRLVEITEGQFDE